MNAPVRGAQGAQSAIAQSMRDAAPAAACTLWDLRALVREELAEALSELEQQPALIDQKALARHLGVSERTVYTLREQGCPTVMVLESPRFELAAALAWLKGRVQP